LLIVTAGILSAPTTLVAALLLAGARPGNSEEFQTVPRITEAGKSAAQENETARLSPTISPRGAKRNDRNTRVGNRAGVCARVNQIEGLKNPAPRLCSATVENQRSVSSVYFHPSAARRLTRKNRAALRFLARSSTLPDTSNFRARSQYAPQSRGNCPMSVSLPSRNVCSSDDAHSVGRLAAARSRYAADIS